MGIHVTTDGSITVGDRGADGTILPPKPKFMVRVYSTHSMAGYSTREWMTLDNAIYDASQDPGAFRIAFTLPNEERCWLERQEPNWFFRLLGYTTEWVYKTAY